MDSANVSQNLAVDPANERQIRLEWYKHEMTILARSAVLEIEKRHYI